MQDVVQLSSIAMFYYSVSYSSVSVCFTAGVLGGFEGHVARRGVEASFTFV